MKGILTQSQPNVIYWEVERKVVELQAKKCSQTGECSSNMDNFKETWEQFTALFVMTKSNRDVLCA